MSMTSMVEVSDIDRRRLKVLINDIAKQIIIDYKTDNISKCESVTSDGS